MSNLYTEGYFERGVGSNYFNYGNDPGWWTTANILRNFIYNETTPEDGAAPKLLELGSAKGYFLFAATLWGFDAYGVDVSEYAISKTVKVAGVEIKNLLHDISKYHLPFEDGTFDIVCSWEVLEHIHGEDIDFVLSDSLRVLKSGGLYVHRIAITDGQMGPDNDDTHVLMVPRIFWEKEFRYRGLLWESEYEKALSRMFAGRDWAERFFVWRKP